MIVFRKIVAQTPLFWVKADSKGNIYRFDRYAHPGSTLPIKNTCSPKRFLTVNASEFVGERIVYNNGVYEVTVASVNSPGKVTLSLCCLYRDEFAIVHQSLCLSAGQRLPILRSDLDADVGHHRNAKLVANTLTGLKVYAAPKRVQSWFLFWR